jgi:hypothetical protein
LVGWSIPYVPQIIKEVKTMCKRINFFKTILFLSFLVTALYTLTVGVFADSFYTESEVKEMYDVTSPKYIGQYTNYECSGIKISNTHIVGSDNGIKVYLGDFDVTNFKYQDVAVFVDFALYDKNNVKVGFGNMPVAISGTTPLTTIYTHEIPYDCLPVRADVKIEIPFRYEYFHGNINAYDYCKTIDAPTVKIVPDNYNEINSGQKMKVNSDIDAKANKPLTFKDKVKIFLIIVLIILILCGFFSSNNNNSFHIFWVDGKMHTYWRL